MTQTPFYDPNRSYEENFNNGPYGTFKENKIFKEKGSPKYKLFNNKIFSPFGIPAGPLLNGKFVKAALDMGFDVPVYKTVRTRKYPCNSWPNVLAVRIKGNLTLNLAEKGVIANHEYKPPISITNSFGVPSFDPDFWQKDMADAVKHAKNGQVVIGSFQGTTNPKGNIKSYIRDFVLAARLVKETGAKILEINLSCPNEGSANLLCFDIERSRKVIEAVRNEAGNTPVVIKIAYFKSDSQLEKLVKTVGKIIDGVSAINTIPAKIYNKDGKQALPGKNRLYSGVCGYSIKWAGIDEVERLKKIREDLDLKFTIIGVGGVTNIKDYKDYRNAGADVIMSATGAMWDPLLAQKIKKVKMSI